MDPKVKAVAAILTTVVFGALFLVWYTKGNGTSRLGVSKTIKSGYDNMMLSDEKGNIKTLVFPAGMILMWAGSIADIPDGWGLCNGTKGTPDLRGRFILGANPNADKNETLTVYETGATGGVDTVSLTTDQVPAPPRFVGGYLSSQGEDRFGGSFPMGSTGSGQPHENRPPYYSLALIMKLAD